MHHAHKWSPLRVLTPHFQIETLLSRPLDERAIVPRSGIEPNFLRTSKASERTSAMGTKLVPDGGIEPATNELQRIAAKPLEPGIKLVLLGENRTAVTRLQNGFPASERQEHGVNGGNRTLTGPVTAGRADHYTTNTTKWTCAGESNAAVSFCRRAPGPPGSRKLAPKERIELSQRSFGDRLATHCASAKLAPVSGLEPEAPRLTVSFPYRQGPTGMERNVGIEPTSSAGKEEAVTKLQIPQMALPR